MLASAAKARFRLYREEGLTVRKRRARRKAIGNRAPILVEVRANARWSLDFVHDQFACGRRFRILNIVEDVTRECLAAIPDTSISGRRVARELTTLIERRGRPGMIVSELPLERHWSERQWRRHRTDLDRDPEVVRREPDRMARHRARQADAERFRGKFQRPHAGRVLE